MYQMIICVFCFIALSITSIYAEEKSDSLTKTYVVTKVVFLDDDGYNDEIFVVLGEGELFLTIRWYTGTYYFVGDKVEVYFDDQDPLSLIVDGQTYDYESDNFYTLG